MEFQTWFVWQFKLFYRTFEDSHEIVEFKRLRGSSYNELPEKLRHPIYKLKNNRNQDNMCYKWTVACHFCKDEKMVTEYKKY
jgi:hypothetical protein